MDQWINYFPPLNLWNYNMSWSWFIDSEVENFFEQENTHEQIIGHTQSSTR